MYLGNVSDTLANIALAGFASICLFWAMTLIIIGRAVSPKWYRTTAARLGGSLVLSSFYFATISLSTGVMVGSVPVWLVSWARFVFFVDIILKATLTMMFVYRRYKSDDYLDWLRGVWGGI